MGCLCNHNFGGLGAARVNDIRTEEIKDIKDKKFNMLHWINDADDYQIFRLICFTTPDVILDIVQCLFGQHYYMVIYLLHSYHYIQCIKVFVLLDIEIMIILNVLHKSWTDLQIAQSAPLSACERYPNTLVVTDNIKHSLNLIIKIRSCFIGLPQIMYFNT